MHLYHSAYVSMCLKDTLLVLLGLQYFNRLTFETQIIPGALEWWYGLDCGVESDESSVLAKSFCPKAEMLNMSYLCLFKLF